MSSNSTTLLFSHGFGVLKDNLGLFTFLSEKLEKLGYECVLFDYYEYDEDKKEILTVPFSKQAPVLQGKLDEIKKNYPGKDIKIIAQSQGCVIPALVDMDGVSSVLAISPFFVADKKKTLKKYQERGADVDFDGISVKERSNGDKVIIPPEYWQERFSTDQYAFYNDLASKVDLKLIYGSEDKVVNEIDLDRFDEDLLIKLPGDHDFTGDSREGLYKVLLRFL